MAEYIITRASIINRLNSDGRVHFMLTETERPCSEAYLKKLRDIYGNKCSRYFIQLDTIEDLDSLGTKYNVDVVVTRNDLFEDYIAIVLYDEVIDKSLCD